MLSVVIRSCFGFFILVTVSAGADRGTDRVASPSNLLTMIDWKRLDVVDYLRSTALLVAFSAIFLSDVWGKRHDRGKSSTNMWITAEVISFFVCGLAAYFFPATILEYISRTSLNSLHLYSMQAIGCVLVGSAITTGRQQKALQNDRIVHSSWLVSRLIASGTLFLFLVWAHLRLDIFTDQNATFILLGVLLWFIGCLYQTFSCDKLGTAGTHHSLTCGINFYLLMDLFFTMMMALNLLSHPEIILNILKDIKPDGFNLHLLQMSALLSVGSILGSFGSFYFVSDSEKRDIFVGRLVTIAMLVPLLALYQWKHMLLKQNWLVFSVLATLIHLIICLRGYFILDSKVKSY